MFKIETDFEINLMSDFELRYGGDKKIVKEIDLLNLKV